MSIMISCRYSFHNLQQLKFCLNLLIIFFFSFNQNRKQEMIFCFP